MEPRLSSPVPCFAVDLLPFDQYAASLNRKRTSAGVLFRDEPGRVLLVKPTYKKGWDLPGGVVGAEEPPWRAAVREIREELGFHQPLGRLLVIDYIPTEEPMPEGLAFVFDGGLITEDEVAAIKSTDPEIGTVRLYTVDEARTLMTPRLARRIESALHAALDGGTTFCESGEPVEAPRR